MSECNHQTADGGGNVKETCISCDKWDRVGGLPRAMDRVGGLPLAMDRVGGLPFAMDRVGGVPRRVP